MIAAAILVILALSVLLILAGSAKLNQRADEWARYELHPPDDDDGVSLLEDNDENSRRS